MLNVKKTSLITVLWILLLFRPTIISRYSALDSLVSLVVNISSFAVLALWGLKAFRVDKWILSVGVLFAAEIVFTLINGGEMTTIYAVVKIFAAILVWRKLYKKNSDDFLRLMRNVLFFLVLINLVSMIVYPEGMLQVHRDANEYYEYNVAWWIFGNKNSMLMWLYLLNVLAQLDIMLNEKRGNRFFIDCCMILSTILTAFMGQSSTTIGVLVALSVFIPLYRFFSNRFVKGLLTPVSITVVYIIFTVILMSATQFNVFGLIAGIFGKDITFTGRTNVWVQAVALIFRRPWLGYGMLSDDASRGLFGRFGAVNSHNTLLQSFLNGGVILGVGYIALFYLLCRKIWQISERYVKERTFLMFAMLILAIAASFESYMESMRFWNVVTVIYYLVNLIQEREFNEESEKIIQ